MAAGPNGAKPHHHPTHRRIEKGEPVVIDMGAKYNWYCSDITRTVVLGKADDTFRKVYDTVLAAQETAEATVRAAMTGGDTDELARTVIAQAGHGEHFGHSLGHGIGLATRAHDVEIRAIDEVVIGVEGDMAPRRAPAGSDLRARPAGDLGGLWTRDILDEEEIVSLAGMSHVDQLVING